MVNQILSLLRSVAALLVGGNVTMLLLYLANSVVSMEPPRHPSALYWLFTIPICLVAAVAGGFALGAVAPKAPVVHAAILSVLLVVVNAFQPAGISYQPLYLLVMLCAMALGLLAGASYWSWHERARSTR